MRSVWRQACMFGAIALFPAWISAQEIDLVSNEMDRIDELNRLHGELDSVERQLQGLHDLYSQDPRIARLKRAAAQARAAAEEAVEKQRQADTVAAAAEEEYRMADRKIDCLERKRSVIRARIERMPDMVEARLARDKARSEAEALAQAAVAGYEELYRAKLQDNPEWVRLISEADTLRRQEYALRSHAERQTRRLTQAPEVIEAEKALALAESAYGDRLREAVAGTVEGKVALGVVAELDRQRQGLERKLALARDKAAKDPRMKELREAVERCGQHREEKDRTYRLLVDRELNRNEEAIELRAVLHRVHSGLRERLEARLAEIQKAIMEEADVAAASNARAEASRAYGKACDVYDQTLRALAAAHPDAAAPSAVLQELRDASVKVRDLQTEALRDNRQVMEAYQAQKNAENTLTETRRAVSEKAKQIVARDPEGAALLKRKNEIENAIRKTEAEGQRQH